MERQLQERLIGATVLMSIAVLVVPELLSGPKPGAPPPAAIMSADLSSARSAHDPSHNAEEPPTSSAALDPMPRSAQSPQTAATLPALRPPKEPASPAPPVRSAPPTKPSATSPSPLPPRPHAVASPVETSKPVPPPAGASAAPLAGGHGPVKPSSEKRSSEKGGWTVQVGSYAQSGTAKRIAKDLQNHGFAAVVLPVDLQGKRLYRVRVGPATDRKTASETLRRVQRLMPSSRLVGNK